MKCADLKLLNAYMMDLRKRLAGFSDERVPNGPPPARRDDDKTKLHHRKVLKQSKLPRP
jgi:hypothetical protein